MSQKFQHQWPRAPWETTDTVKLEFRKGWLPFVRKQGIVKVRLSFSTGYQGALALQFSFKGIRKAIYIRFSLLRVALYLYQLPYCLSLLDNASINLKTAKYLQGSIIRWYSNTFMPVHFNL